MEEPNDNFKEYSNEELRRIITQRRHNYSLEFLTEAEYELLRREDLPISEPQEAPPRVVKEEKEQEPAAQSTALSAGMMILCFFIPTIVTPLLIIINSYFFEAPELNYAIIPVCLLIQYGIYRNIRFEGLEEKANEFKIWIQNTWIVYGGIYLTGKILTLLFGIQLARLF